MNEYLKSALGIGSESVEGVPNSVSVGETEADKPLVIKTTDPDFDSGAGPAVDEHELDPITKGLEDLDTVINASEPSFSIEVDPSGNNVETIIGTGVDNTNDDVTTDSKVIKEIQDRAEDGLHLTVRPLEGQVNDEAEHDASQLGTGKTELSEDFVDPGNELIITKKDIDNLNVIEDHTDGCGPSTEDALDAVIDTLTKEIEKSSSITYTEKEQPIADPENYTPNGTAEISNISILGRDHATSDATVKIDLVEDKIENPEGFLDEGNNTGIEIDKSIVTPADFKALASELEKESTPAIDVEVANDKVIEKSIDTAYINDKVDIVSDIEKDGEQITSDKNDDSTEIIKVTL